MCFLFSSFFSSAYISAARRVSPSVPKELEEYIASAYSTIRQEEAKSNSPHSYTTVRTLLSILRISAVSPDSLFYMETQYTLFVCQNGIRLAEYLVLGKENSLCRSRS